MLARNTAEADNPPDWRTSIRQLQDEISVPMLPLLSVIGFVLALNEEGLPDRLQPISPGMLLFVGPLFVWALRGINRTLAAWVLVLSCLGINLLMVTWDHLDPALCLLGLPVGLAALLLSVPAGALLAGAASALLLLAPPAALPAGGALRAMSAVAVWGTLGLIWLALRPAVTTLQWSWASYERSRNLLDRARDYQVQLKQTLADLADANRQLIRLNQLTDALRHAAEDARRAKEQFVANVSHELRTPLNMIIGFSEMVVQAPQTYANSLPPALLADLDVILRNSQHLSSLIDDILDLSQIEAGRVALSRERVALEGIFEAATTAVRPLYESKGLFLTTEIQPGLPPVMCDSARIRAVVLNLLSNAGRFTDRGGVCLRAVREETSVVISVADTGPGIPAEDQDRLFQPFQQLDGSIRRRYGGSGLGLAISKAFVELHGGQMWLESTPGVGTTFFFRVPITPPMPIEAAPARWIDPSWEYTERVRPPTAPVANVRPRLVVMEKGSSTLQRLLSRFMDTVEVQSVEDLEGAIEELSREPAQALLINEPSIGEALQRVQQSGRLPKEMPAIICSIPSVTEAVGTLGIADYLVKPVKRGRFLEVLDGLGLNGGTVLIVDDEPDAVRMMQRVLSSTGRGYRVLRAADGQQALSIMREQRPDIVFLDLLMPEVSGFQLLDIRSQDADLRSIPVVVISACDPIGQPIASTTLAVTRGAGLSAPQILACVQALTGILTPLKSTAYPGPPAG